MTVSISVWLKDILPRTPSIVRAVARRELILTAREFYKESTAWRGVVESVFWSDNTYGHTVASPDVNAEILQVLAVEVNGVELTAKVQRPVGERGDGTPTLWYPTGPDTIEIWPTPEQYDDDVLVRVALIPTVTATTLPDVAMRSHYEALLDGVLGRLYAHPAKPYSNQQLGAYHLNRFRNAIAAAKGETIQGGFAGQNWQYPTFGK
jgi:hypothetical protein